MNEQQKLCAKCGEVKSCDQYYKDRAKRDGLQSYCKLCCIASSKQWNEENPASHKGYMKKYYEKHREERLAYQRERRRLKKESQE